MLRQMLVPVDFSTCARQVARHAFDLARAIGGQVTLLHVLEDQEPGEARDLLRLLSTLARRPPECLITPASSAFPNAVATVILDVAAGRRTDLIVLGLRGLSLRGVDLRDVGLGSVGLGSVGLGGPAQRSPLGQVAVAVLLGAHVPVQLVPCGQAAAPTHESWRSFLIRDSLEQGSLMQGGSVQGDLEQGVTVTPGAIP